MDKLSQASLERIADALERIAACLESDAEDRIRYEVVEDPEDGPLLREVKDEH